MDGRAPAQPSADVHEDDGGFAEHVAHAFAEMDTNGSGAINYFELRTWLVNKMRGDAGSSNKTVSDEQAQRCRATYARHSRESDDQLGVDEVAALLRDCVRVAEEHARDHRPEQAGAHDGDFEDLLVKYVLGKTPAALRLASATAAVSALSAFGASGHRQSQEPEPQQPAALAAANPLSRGAESQQHYQQAARQIAMLKTAATRMRPARAQLPDGLDGGLPDGGQAADGRSTEGPNFDSVRRVAMANTAATRMWPARAAQTPDNLPTDRLDGGQPPNEPDSDGVLPQHSSWGHVGVAAQRLAASGARAPQAEPPAEQMPEGRDFDSIRGVAMAKTAAAHMRGPQTPDVLPAPEFSVPLEQPDDTPQRSSSWGHMMVAANRLTSSGARAPQAEPPAEQMAKAKVAVLPERTLGRAGFEGGGVHTSLGRRTCAAGRRGPHGR
eukprot:COSAG04_NODE_4823_length_1877_cov_3.543307_1_plen_440_part_00